MAKHRKPSTTAETRRRIVAWSRNVLVRCALTIGAAMVLSASYSADACAAPASPVEPVESVAAVERYDAGACRTFHGAITITQCVPLQSPSGAPVETVWEDGSAEYADGAVYDPEDLAFR